VTASTRAAARQRLVGRMARRLRRALLVTTLAVLAWAAGLFWFAASIARQPPADDRVTDAIVVLTGGSERLTTGFELLSQGRARKLFISGVYRGVDVRELMRVSRQGGELESRIAIGYAADDTAGNAEETAGWMGEEGFASLRLVTANYHMPRSLVEFRRHLPEVEVVPHPVKPGNVRLDNWWSWPGTAALIVEEYNKWLLARLRLSLGL